MSAYIELYRTPSAMYAPVIINVSQHDYRIDAAAEELSFRIKSDEGHYISFKSMAVWLIAARPDGVIYEIAGMIKDWDPGDATYLEFKMIKGLTDVPGDVICEIAWIFPSGSVGNQAASIQRATQNFVLRVEPSPKAIYGNKNTVIDGSGGGYTPYEPDEPADEPKYRLVVATPPAKTSYNEGDALNLAGVKINLEKYTDSQGVLETTDVTNACTYTPGNNQTLTTSNSAIQVSYLQGGSTLTASISISVAAAQYRLTIATPPTKTVYTEGDALDLTGLRVNLEKYAGSRVLETTNVTTQCTYQPAAGTALTPSDTTVTVTYTM